MTRLQINKLQFFFSWTVAWVGVVMIWAALFMVLMLLLLNYLDGFGIANVIELKLGYFISEYILDIHVF